MIRWLKIFLSSGAIILQRPCTVNNPADLKSLQICRVIVSRNGASENGQKFLVFGHGPEFFGDEFFGGIDG